MTATEAEVVPGEVVEDATDPQYAGPESLPEPPAGASDDEETVEAAEIVEPGDVATPEGVVEIRSPQGHLTLRPEQSVADLDREQQAGLLAIGIDVEKDPGVWPHLRAFIHMCQLRRLDPYAKEAYLIGRGKGDYRKWTMQTSIDGYRKLAASTGRLKRVKARLWTGSDDDPTCWREVEEDGVLIRKRIWYDQWPSSRGNPGSAMVIVEHYDEQGHLTTTSATADWKFYAPMTPKYTGYGNNRRKVLDAQGNEVLELSEMWEKGDAHMLSKCCEALAYRLAFPNTVHGFYVAEEMHRADQQERNRQIEEQRAAARAKISKARAGSDQRALMAEASAPPAVITTTVTHEGEPVPIGASARETVDSLRAATRAPRGESRAPASALGGVSGARVDEPERLAMLVGEVLMLADLFQQPKEQLFARQIEAYDKPLEQFTAGQLHTIVMPMRAPAAERLRASGRGGEAAAYETVPSGAVMAVEHLLGTSTEAETTEVDLTQPHTYRDAGGVCECDAFEDEAIHRVV